MTTEKLFNPDLIQQWWQDLQKTKPDGKPNPTSNPGALARLRRYSTTLGAMTEPATLDLFRRLGRTDPQGLPRVAVVAMVLAHVREDTGPSRKAIQAVAKATPEDTAKLSPLRLRRLLASREEDELSREMRRFVSLADRKVNVRDLGSSLLYWNDSTRTQWAFDYHNAGFAAPTNKDVSP